ncbi:MAG: dephospho-CoA kinase [Bacteroidota bacterium]|nr:dephospho-CoA kinase [Bacteroidota bacterium]
MKKIGITGGIGTGKSTVCEIFKVLGVPVFNSDLESKNILNTDSELKNNLIEQFGNQIYMHNGLLNKALFGFKIFNDKNKLKLANSIIHPAVKKQFQQWCKNYYQNKYILKEAAILFESGAHKQLDAVIAVSTPENIRIKRIMQRDNTTEEEIRARISKQWSQEKVNKMADYVIQNDGINLLLPQVFKLHELFNN